MIKVKIYLNGGNYEYLAYVCNETEEDFLEAAAASDIMIFTDAETGAVITVPTNKYIIEVFPHNPDK